MGTETAKDPLVFGSNYGPDKIIYPVISEGGRYLLIHVLYGSAADKTEIYFQDLAAKGPLRPVVNDLDARFMAEIGGDTLFLHTNWNAPKGRILAVDLKNPSRNQWREIVPEGSAVIDSVTAAAQRLFVNYTENASSHVRVFDASGRYLRDLKLPTLGSVTGFSGRWTSKEAFFGFTSFATPRTVFRYEPISNRQEVWGREQVPIHSEQFRVRQVWFESKDGTRVPMFLVHLKGLRLDGSVPTLLTGYGGFNLSNTPYFSTTAALWAENGGVFALANLRGGGEFGEQWHEAGMLAKKQNVFDDFIAAAEWLIKERYTNPSRLAIEGTSNGGLLVGAALTQRPDLFGAAACGYPLLDMLRYQKFLVAKYWVSEYGSSDNPEQFRYLYAYSPYHHVRPGTKYPAVLFFSGDSDTRVAPLHARKMTALLQSATASGRPILLRYDTEAGHSRALPVSKQIDESADVLGFLFWQLGVPFPNPRP
jgi:prolyl oligopeptidase